MYETKDWVFAGLGVIGIALGAVALVIAIGAKNDAVTEAELSSSLKGELTDKASALKRELAKDVRQTSSAAGQARKGISKANKAQHTADQAASEADAVSKRVKKLEGETKALNTSVDDLEREQAALKKSIDKLRRQVNQLARDSGRDG